MIFKRGRSTTNQCWSKLDVGLHVMQCIVVLSMEPRSQGWWTSLRFLGSWTAQRETQSQVPPSGYLTACHGKSPFVIGKPSISIRAMASMAMLNNQRVLWCVMIMVILWYNYYDIMVILYYYWFWSIMIMQNGIMIYYDNPWDWDTLVNQVEWNGIGMET